MNEQLAIQIAANFLKQPTIEGFRSNAYWDANGYAYGYGFHTTPGGRPVQVDDTISKSEADDYLVNSQCPYYWRQVKGCITADINEYQAAALISLAFNAGPGFECGSKLLQLINSGAPDDQIAAQFQISAVTSNGKPLAVLYTRRASELNLFFTAAQIYAENNPVKILIGGALVVATLGYYLYRATKIK